MTLQAFQTSLHKILADEQQDGISNILSEIKNSDFIYDKVKFKEIENSMNPVAMALMAHSLVASTRVLINTLALASPRQQSDYLLILERIQHNRGIGTTDILQAKTVNDLEERELSRLFQQERAIYELTLIDRDWTNQTIHQRLVNLALAENGHLRKGTFLCMGKRSQISTLVPTAETQFTHYKGLGKTDILNMEEVKGCLIQQYERVMQLLRTHIPLGRDRTTDEDVYEIPLVSVREFVANAFVHRDYSQEARTFIQIELYDDRLEIKSPGQLPENLDLTNIQGTMLVNPSIMAIFHLYKYVEKRGSGIEVAQDALRKQGLESAKIENIVAPQIVKVTIFRKQNTPSAKVNESHQKKIMERLQEYDLAGVFALLDEMGINDFVYNRLKKEFIMGKLDVDFVDRMQVYIKSVAPEKADNQDNKPNFDIKKIMSFIAKGNLEKALSTLLELGEEYEFYTQIVLLSARFKENEKAKNLGTISNENYLVERNQIGAALLAILSNS